MCGRYAIFTEDENQEFREIINDINERYKDEPLKMKTGEVFPTDTVPVITAGPENSRTVNLFRWGFPKFIQPGRVIINARSETLQEKPTFRKLIHKGRCIIPASGFYEWKASEGKKVKHFIHTADSSFFYMAGLYNSFVDKKGNPFTGFVIITTEANSQMAQIHNRMPVILERTDTKAWLTGSESNFEVLKRLLIPYRNLLDIDS